MHPSNTGTSTLQRVVYTFQASLFLQLIQIVLLTRLVKKYPQLISQHSREINCQQHCQFPARSKYPSCYTIIILMDFQASQFYIQATHYSTSQDLSLPSLYKDPAISQPNNQTTPKISLSPPTSPSTNIAQSRENISKEYNNPI